LRVILPVLLWNIIRQFSVCLDQNIVGDINAEKRREEKEKEKEG